MWALCQSVQGTGDLVENIFVLCSMEEELFLSVTARACFIKLKSFHIKSFKHLECWAFLEFESEEGREIIWPKLVLEEGTEGFALSDQGHLRDMR